MLCVWWWGIQVESLMRSNTDMYYGIPKLRKDLQAMNEHLESLDQRMQQRAQQANDNLDGRMGALDQKVGILDDKMEAMGALDQKVGILDDKMEAMSKMLASLLDKMEQQEQATIATATAASPRRRLSSNKSKA